MPLYMGSLDAHLVGTDARTSNLQGTPATRPILTSVAASRTKSTAHQSRDRSIGRYHSTFSAAATWMNKSAKATRTERDDNL